MKQAYHPSGGKWKREYMPRLVLVFLNADPHLTQTEQNQAAYQVAISTLKAYWNSTEETIVNGNLRNIVWGCPPHVAAQLRNKYHAQDRLMLCFDFFNHDSVAACQSMRMFMELVVPLMQDEHALNMLQPQSIEINNRNLSPIVQHEVVLVIDLLPPMEDVDEAQWTCEWLKNSCSDIQTQIFKGINDCWPAESDLTECLGVVITGSTCSCLDDYPHTESLFAFFEKVIRLEIPLLTICYSAQMLVRWLAGKEYVVRLLEPHVGFVRVEYLKDCGIGHCLSLLNDMKDGSSIFSSAQSDGFILPD